jgi:mono/diheme cytochrome c family protein
VKKPAMRDCSLSLCCLFLFTANLAAEEKPFAHYLDHVKPLLTEKCIGCHGPVKQESGLRLDTGKFIKVGSDFNAVVNLKKPDESEILKRVTTTHAEERMPPEGEGERLKPGQIKILSDWIAAGMPAPDDEVALEDPRDHWAYQTIVRPDLPGGSGNPIDRFLTAKHQAADLTPYPRAEKSILLRRAYLDIIGLNPNPRELKDFLADESPDAYGQLIDKLLNDPRHGERWARHWMDVWRYSDWSGYKNALRGSQRHIWHWRDWIVESLNHDKGYDRMVVEMLAGDELAPGDPQTLRATGFLTRNFHNSNRNIWLDATVEHTAKAFLGMTVNCARCHDHKFDPIPQTDYYELRAIFEPYHVRTERLPGQPNLSTDGISRVYDQKPDEPTFVYIRGNEKEPDKENPVSPNVPDVIELPFSVTQIDLPPIAFFPALAEHIQQEDLDRAKSALKIAEQTYQKTFADIDENNIAAAIENIPSAPSLPENLTEGQIRAEYQVVSARLALSSLQARWKADHNKHNRTEQDDSSKWADLSKIAANNERQYNFAVARQELFEKRTAYEKTFTTKHKDAATRQSSIEKASKEWQAAVKKWEQTHTALNKTDHKYTSVGKEYPKQSTGRRLALARWITHPKNPLTARVAVNHIWLRHFGTPLVENVFDFGLRSSRPEHAELLDWLSAELMEHNWSMRHIHQLILTSDAWQRQSSSNDAELMSHNLSIDADNKLYWKANIQRLEAEIIRDNVMYVAGKLDLTQGGPDIDYVKGEEVLRRSLYFRHAYEKQMTMLTLFDAASPNECYRRSESILPQQALVLANSDLAIRMSIELAKQLDAQMVNDEEFLTFLFLHTLTRKPTHQETDACLKFLIAQEQRLSDTSQLTSFETEAVKKTVLPDDPKLRARANLAHVLMNHNDFITVR